jgi:hypothetical protein
VHIPTRTNQAVKIGIKLDGFDRHCPQTASLTEINWADHPEIMRPPVTVVPDHFGSVNTILQNCGDVDMNTHRGTLIGNIENSTQNKHIMTREQEEKEIWCNKWTNKMLNAETRRLHQQKEKLSLFWTSSQISGVNLQTS